MSYSNKSKQPSGTHASEFSCSRPDSASPPRGGSLAASAYSAAGRKFVPLGVRTANQSCNGRRTCVPRAPTSSSSSSSSSLPTPTSCSPSRAQASAAPTARAPPASTSSSRGPSSSSLTSAPLVGGSITACATLGSGASSSSQAVEEASGGPAVSSPTKVLDASSSTRASATSSAQTPQLTSKISATVGAHIFSLSQTSEDMSNVSTTTGCNALPATQAWKPTTASSATEALPSEPSAGLGSSSASSRGAACACSADVGIPHEETASTGVAEPLRHGVGKLRNHSADRAGNSAARGGASLSLATARTGQAFASTSPWDGKRGVGAVVRGVAIVRGVVIGTEGPELVSRSFQKPRQKLLPTTPS
mmetsp:Transcript_168176/g.540268  ORF Transcript_168176/g.540268 Transcript_168176/m.540268 type:complete len:363 (-) Transcript_168176:308-1396(-)